MDTPFGGISPKSPQVEQFIKDFTGLDRVSAIKEHRCVMGCVPPMPIWKDKLSIKEYTISGMCQNCQDQVFDSDP